MTQRSALHTAACNEAAAAWSNIHEIKGGKNRTASSPAMCLTRIPRSARPGGVTEGVRTFKKQIKASKRHR